MRILIVDDSPAMRAFIRRVVELSALDIAAFLQAGDGREALRLLARETADVILTDINMPGMDGGELIERLRQDSQLAAIPVVVVSTDATSERMEQMLARGASGYVTKPFSPEALRAELERVLESTHA